MVTLIMGLPVTADKVRADGNEVPTVYQGVDYSYVYDYNYYIAKYADIRMKKLNL